MPVLPAELNLRCIAGQTFYHRFSYVHEDGSPVLVGTDASRVRYVIRRYPWPSDPPGDPMFFADESNGSWDMLTVGDALPNIEIRIPSLVTELWVPGVYVHELDYLYNFGVPPTPDWSEKVFRGAVSIFPAFMIAPAAA
jgi:hypothetical protein